MPIGTQLLQHIVYRYCWVIPIVVTVSYSDDTFGYIQIEIIVSYSDSTYGYIQLFPYPLLRYMQT